MRISSLVALASFTALVTADGFVQFDIERRISSSGSSRLRRRDIIYTEIAQNLENLAEYIINVTVGTPGQQLGVTLDTGSSDLWIPSANFCRSTGCDFGSFDPSASSSYQVVQAGGFNITYAAAGDSDAGDWATDSVSIGGASAIQNQLFGLSNDGADAHGVLGVGYDSHETYGPDGETSYASVMDNLKANGLINRKAYSLYLNAYDEDYGSIVFGGVDTTKYSGDLVALPLQAGPGGEGIAEFYVTLSKVTFTDTVGKVSTLSPDGYAQSVLLDSGTSFTGLTNDVLDNLARGLGAAEIGDTQVLVVPCHYNTTNATINYTFGGPDGVTVSVPLAATIGEIWENECILEIGSTGGGGVSVLGDSFLRNAYVVFDIDNNLAAMAQAVEDRVSTSSIVAIPSGTDIPGVTSTAVAPGTQLSEDDATKSPTLLTASNHHSTIVAVSPTFNLGTAAATTTGSSTSSTSVSKAGGVPAATNAPAAGLCAMGLIIGALVL